MCTCPTKSGPRGTNTVGEEHLQTWHVLTYTNVYCWERIWSPIKRIYNYVCVQGRCTINFETASDDIALHTKK